VECFIFTVVQLLGNFNKNQSSGFDENHFNFFTRIVRAVRQVNSLL
jgi:hypothetical protein